MRYKDVSNTAISRPLYAPVIGLLLIAALIGCSAADDPTHHREFLVFGTLVELTIYGVDADTARKAGDLIEWETLDMHRRWHAWEPGELQRLNTQLAAGRDYRAPADILALVSEANRLSVLSHGLFNPTIGQLVDLWGFHADEYDGFNPPTASAVQSLVEQHPSATDITIDKQTIRSGNPAVRYDLGGIAKGYAIDRMMERMTAMGIRNAMLNTGGDLRAIGQPGGRPWRIGIRHPRKAGAVLATIELDGDASVFTSGDYERFYEADGRRYHHIIDPRSGYPVTGTSSVTVIHSLATTADAAATALFVAGPKEWPAIAAAMGIEQVLRVDHEGTIFITPAMQKRVTFSPDDPLTIHTVPIPEPEKTGIL